MADWKGQEPERRSHSWEEPCSTNDHGERDLERKLNSGLSSQRKRDLHGWEARILHMGLVCNALGPP